jgi:ADP-L-glycero-D-manno-heptose 6-epimerase
MKYPSDRILVTGGAGFIGSALVHGLNQKGHTNIHITDRLGTDEKWKNLSALVYNDYIEADELMGYIESHPHSRLYSLILHLGACSSTMETDASYLVQNNYRFTHRLAQYAIHTKTRFVYASSAATYGDGSKGMDDKDTSIQNYRPLNMYGYSKQMFDLHAQQHGWLQSITGIKYFNVFGPNENHKGEMRSLVNKAYHQIQETGRLQLFRSHRPDYEDGMQLRDFLYVKDAVAMTLHLAKIPSATGLYNLGSGKAHTWIDLANAIFKAMGKEPQIDFVDMPESIRDKYQYKTEADISKLRETGYDTPLTPLEGSVADYIQNYLAKDKLLGDEDR